MQSSKIRQFAVHKWSAIVLITAASVLMLAGTASQARNSSSVPAQTAAKTDAASQVLIENYRFNPATLTVKVGTTVAWINHDDDSHTVDGAQGKYKSKLLDKGDKFEFRFTEPGEYPFTCRLHPKMAGKIIVQP